MPSSKSAAKKVEPVESKPVESKPVVDTKSTSKATKAAKSATDNKPTTTTPIAAAATTTKAKKETKKTTTNAPTTAPTDVAQVENVVVTTDTESSITGGFTDFITKFQSMLTQFSTLKSELKNLERRTVKELKVVQKLNNKKKRKGTRAPSGFVKPSPISDELAKFLGKEKGVEMARTDVTREINQYIRAHNLQDKENGRKINPDEPLRNLLKLTTDSDVVLTLSLIHI